MTSQVLSRFIHAIWLGSGLFLIAVAAPAAFRASPNATAAADVVGAMLGRWHYIALAAPLALLILDWKRARVWVLGIVFVAIVLAAMQAFIDLRIRAIRRSSPIPISELSRQDPVRRQFGMLHGFSSLLLLAQVIAAGAALAVDKEAYGAQDSGLRAPEKQVASSEIVEPVPEPGAPSPEP